MKKKDLPLTFLIGLFNVYLGNDRAWGVDKAFYVWSDWIIYSIASLDNEILENVIADKSLPVYKFFDEVPQKIISSLSLDNKISFNNDLQQNFKSYVVLISLLHKLGKLVFLEPLLSKYKEIGELCKEKKFYFNSISNKDNYLFWRSITYIQVVILNDQIDEIIDLALINSKDINVDGLFKEYIPTDVLYLSSLYYNLIIYQSDKCIDMVKKMSFDQLSVLAIAIAKPECLNKLINNIALVTAIKEALEPEINSENLSAILCLALKQFWGYSLSNDEKQHVKNYFESTKFMSSSIFWKDHCDTVGLLLAAFEKEQLNVELDVAVQRYAKSYGAFLELVNKSYSIPRFIRYIQGNIYSKTEGIYHIRVLLGKALILSNEDDVSIKGAIDYLKSFMKNGELLSIYHTMKLYDPLRFKRISSVTELNKLNTAKVYQDIDFSSTSESLFMLSFIISDHDSLCGYELLLKGISNGIMRMNDRKDTIGDYKLFDSLEILLENNWLSTEALISLLERILRVAEKMNEYNIENDTHRLAMEVLVKYDFDAAEFYYNQISFLEESYDLIHFNYAMAMIQRGRSMKDIETCLDNIRKSFDNYHQKFERTSFYNKIQVYLSIAICDFYTTYEQKRCFEQACLEIDALEEAGWDRELMKEEYEIYCQLCSKHNKAVDVKKEREISYPTICSNKETPNIVEILTKIYTEDDLNEFLKKLDREYSLESLEINDLLIKKSIDITGNINGVIQVLIKSYYPSSTFYTNNGNKFWMTAVSALRNQDAKKSILEYLLTSGGGHDGLNELIKIYGFLGNQGVCVNAFEKMLSCIEFLIC